ncbi:O-antigen ligase family protein [Dictyobacter arantiisoli]|nr:O-antigen ligase family protein [Dictyobacter arantiisoli]
MALVFTILVILRLDILTAMIVVVIHLYADWYLGLHLIAPLLAIMLLIAYYLTRSTRHPWVQLRCFWLWGLFLGFTIYPAIRGGLVMTYDAASFYPSDIMGALLMYWIGSLIVYDKWRLRFFFFLFSCLASLLALHTLYQNFTGTILFASSKVAVFLSQSDVAYYQMSGTNVQRTGSFFIDPNWNGAFLAMAFFLPTGLFISETNCWRKLCALLMMTVILLALMCTYSTGAWVAFLFGIGVLCLFSGKMLYCIALPIASFCVAVLLATLFPSQIALQMRHISANNELSLRIATWQTALRVIRAHPWDGVGLGHQIYLIQSNIYRVPAQFVMLSHPHDSYLEWAAMAGIPVAGIFISLLIATLWLAYRNWRCFRGASRTLIGSGIAAMVTLSINSISINGWTHFALAMMAWLILGAISSPLLCTKDGSTDTQESE